MKRNDINAEDLKKWMDDSWHMYASKGTTRLRVTFSGIFRVYVQGEIVYEGNVIEEAVKAYNDAQP